MLPSIPMYLMVSGLLSTPTCCRLGNTKLVQNDCQIQIVPIAIFFIILSAHMNILFIIKVRICVLIKWSQSPPLPPHPHTQ